jgi:hypothetical protein
MRILPPGVDADPRCAPGTLRCQEATLSRRLRSGSSFFATFFFVAACSFLVASSAHAQKVQLERGASGWIHLPNPPELSPAWTGPPIAGDPPRCDEIPRNPNPQQLDCWSDYVTGIAMRVHDAQKGKQNRPLKLACFEGGFEVTDSYPTSDLEAPDAPSFACRSDTVDKCTRVKRTFMQSEGADIPTLDTLALPISMSRRLANEYSAFLNLRSGHQRSRYHKRLAALTLKQGLTVLYLAERMRRMQEVLEKRDCGTDPMAPYFELASEVQEELARGILAPIREVYPTNHGGWEARLFDLQTAVLSGAQDLAADTDWDVTCKESRRVQDGMDGFDAGVNAWCGYSYLRAGAEDLARKHFTLGRQSVNDPDLASYSSWALRNLLEKGDDW